jgi:hypothetical protein
MASDIVHIVSTCFRCNFVEKQCPLNEKASNGSILFDVALHGLRLKGKGKDEGEHPVPGRLCDYIAAMGAGNVPCDKEPQAFPLDLLVRSIQPAIVRLKEMRHLFL